MCFVSVGEEALPYGRASFGFGSERHWLVMTAPGYEGWLTSDEGFAGIFVSDGLAGLGEGEEQRQRSKPSCEHADDDGDSAYEAQMCGHAGGISDRAAGTGGFEQQFEEIQLRLRESEDETERGDQRDEKDGYDHRATQEDSGDAAFEQLDIGSASEDRDDGGQQQRDGDGFDTPGR